MKSMFCVGLLLTGLMLGCSRESGDTGGSLTPEELAGAMGMTYWKVRLPDSVSTDDMVGLAIKRDDGTVDELGKSSGYSPGQLIKAYIVTFPTDQEPYGGIIGKGGGVSRQKLGMKAEEFRFGISVDSKQEFDPGEVFAWYRKEPGALGGSATPKDNIGLMVVISGRSSDGDKGSVSSPEP